MARKQLGARDAAASDLTAAVAEVERQREAIPAGAHRAVYLDHVKEIFDARVAFEYDERHRPDLALSASEDVKARSLLDWMLASGKGELGPLGRARAQARSRKLGAWLDGLPPATAVVEYAVLPRELLIWVMRRGGEVRSASVPLGGRKLADLVSRLREAIADRAQAELQHTAEYLYKVLVQPVAAYFSPADRLVFIPDGPLHRLPFTLLRSPRDHRYLVQDRTLSVAPSARVLASACVRDHDLARLPGGAVLGIAAPDFDRVQNPDLDPLSSGEVDAGLVASFPGAQVLRGAAATPGAFLQAAWDKTLVHFGGHAVVDDGSPLLSRLLLASRPGDSQRGYLYSWSILKQRLPRTRLVVLASCSTGTGSVSKTEGVESLARSFLAIGVPAVAASLWKVGDLDTADFFVRFYRHLAERFDAPEALSSAQREIIEAGSGPKTAPWIWGAFEVVGCSSPR
jgi:CHAT domain-containing protein